MYNSVKIGINLSLMMLMISGCSAARPDDAAGIRSTSPSICPESPNCVSSDATDKRHRIAAFCLKGDFGKNWLEVQRVVAKLPRSTVVRADETYLHATFESRIFRFVDDLELFLNPLNGIISIRSAARTGYWDFGVNRHRAEQLRHLLQSEDIINRP